MAEKPIVGGNFPGNSNKDKAISRSSLNNGLTSKENLKKEPPIAKAIREEETLGRRVYKSLFPEPPAEMAKKFVETTIWPAIRGCVARIAHAAIDDTFGKGNGHGRVVDKDDDDDYTPYSSLSRRRKERDNLKVVRARDGMERIILEYEDDMIKVIRKLQRKVADNEFVTLADLYEMVDIETEFTHHAYGWTEDDIDRVRYRETSDGRYLLIISEPRSLKKIKQGG